jgi:hypothetical protein
VKGWKASDAEATRAADCRRPSAAHQRWSLAEFLRQRRVLVRLVPGRYLELTVQLERQLIRAHRQSEPCRSTGELIPRGLIVAFVRTGLLVSVLALRQFRRRRTHAPSPSTGQDRIPLVIDTGTRRGPQRSTGPS